LQCVTVCCSVLQCVAVCYSVLQCVAVCSSVFQCVPVYCRMLRCVALYYSFPVAITSSFSHICACAASKHARSASTRHFGSPISPKKLGVPQRSRECMSRENPKCLRRHVPPENTWGVPKWCNTTSNDYSKDCK